MQPTRTLADALADSAAGPLLQRIALLQRLAGTISGTVARVAPDFDVYDPTAVNLRENVLVLNARSAAQAAKLRQGIPGLLRLLHQQGFQVIEIRVKVQPARMSYPEETSPQATQVRGEIADRGDPRRVRTRVDAGVVRFAESLDRTLPDCALREAVRRLQRALQRGLSRA